MLTDMERPCTFHAREKLTQLQKSALSWNLRFWRSRVFGCCCCLSFPWQYPRSKRQIFLRRGRKVCDDPAALHSSRVRLTAHIGPESGAAVLCGNIPRRNRLLRAHQYLSLSGKKTSFRAANRQLQLEPSDRRINHSSVRVRVVSSRKYSLKAAP